MHAARDLARGEQSGHERHRRVRVDLHPGGPQFGFCDGSVRFYSNNVDLTAWRAIGTSRGGEPVGDF